VKYVLPVLFASAAVVLGQERQIAAVTTFTEIRLSVSEAEKQVFYANIKVSGEAHFTLTKEQQRLGITRIEMLRLDAVLTQDDIKTLTELLAASHIEKLNRNGQRLERPRLTIQVITQDVFYPVEGWECFTYSGPLGQYTEDEEKIVPLFKQVMKVAERVNEKSLR